MTPIPDVATYQELGALAPEPDDGLCDWCLDFPCRDDCRPPSRRGPAPDGPQGADHRIDIEERGL